MFNLISLTKRKTAVPAKRASKKGFTLIELSIVLVIIGLLVGGILVGQDLIKAAELRATMSQVDRVDVAAQTFRNKYNSLPGDLPNASSFGFTTRTSNGNGAVENCAYDSDSSTYLGCENKFFWNDLTSANLIDGAVTDTASATAGATIATISSTYVPAAKLGRGNFLFVGSQSGINYLRIQGAASAASGLITRSLAMTPNEAIQIDSKKDDGAATTGTVAARAQTTATADADPTSGAGNCYYSSSSSGYNTYSAYATSQLCQLRIRMSF